MLRRSVENDDPAQILRLVWVKALFYTGMESQKLSRHKVWHEQCDFRSIRIQFKQKVRILPDRLRGPVANRNNRTAKLLHFDEHFAFRFHRRLAEKKC